MVLLFAPDRTFDPQDSFSFNKLTPLCIYMVSDNTEAQ